MCDGLLGRERTLSTDEERLALRGAPQLRLSARASAEHCGAGLLGKQLAQQGRLGGLHRSPWDAECGAASVLKEETPDQRKLCVLGEAESLDPLLLLHQTPNALRIAHRPAWS